MGWRECTAGPGGSWYRGWRLAMNFDEWIQYGWEKGWCGPPLCINHDGFPYSEDEDEDMNEGGDPCMHFVRLYEDQDQRLSIELNDSPTNWRASNMGWTRG